MDGGVVFESEFAEFSLEPSRVAAKSQYCAGTSIVIVTYNSRSTISACVRSVLKYLGKDDEIVLVDNDSQDGTRELILALERLDPRIRSILLDQNTGFSAGCNAGIRTADREYVCLLNPDTEVAPGWLERMQVHFEDPHVGAVGPLSDSVASEQHVTLHVPSDLRGDFNVEGFGKFLAELNPGTVQETKILIGFCMLLRREAIDRVELLDEELFLGYDDFDLSWRLQLAGYKLLIACDSFVLHRCHVSFDSEPKSKTDRLVQEAADHLARKLLNYYGAESLPSEEEIWGVRGALHPSFTLWEDEPATDSAVSSNLPSRLCIGLPMEDALVLGYPGQESADGFIDLAKPLPINVPIETKRFGTIALRPDSFSEICCDIMLENALDVARTMASLKELLMDGGRLTIRCMHHMAAETWVDSDVRNLFGPGAFDVFEHCPEAFGWTDAKLVLTETSLLPSELGWVLVVNNDIPVPEAERMARSIAVVDYKFVKTRLFEQGGMHRASGVKHQERRGRNEERGTSDKSRACDLHSSALRTQHARGGPTHTARRVAHLDKQDSVLGTQDLPFDPTQNAQHTTHPGPDLQDSALRTQDLLFDSTRNAQRKTHPESQYSRLNTQHSAQAQPILTMVFATYRRRAKAMRQIDCLLNQTLTNIEIFLVGDHCPQFGDMLEDPYFKAKVDLAKSRGMSIHTINLAQNHGTPHEIINHVIANAKGKYLMFSADDDAMLPDHCESYFRSIEEANVDMVLMKTCLVGEYYAVHRVPKLELGHVGHSEAIVRMSAARSAPPHRPGEYQDFEFLTAVAKTASWKVVSGKPTYFVNLTKRTRLFRAA